MYTVDEIKNNYKKMSDSQIEKIALFESKGLRKDVINILRSEIKNRKLNSDLLNWVNAETKAFKEQEIIELKNKISNLTCPNCLNNTTKLSGFEINKIISFLVYSKETNQKKVLCKNCGNKEKTTSILQNLFFGWWSRNGILATPYLIIKDLINLFYSEKISDRILVKMIEGNTGYFRMNGTEKEILSDFINKFNEI
ncbi:hypothetical protein [uncultured Aquimarina sp.]|uniref:hypothetical protein n=1 Tax=uncultured Aquimarina sp. TaxID=575652 RepID=UPI00260A2E81|nr:hypothetical protein [uncultured Aquimarina sp.]